MTIFVNIPKRKYRVYSIEHRVKTKKSTIGNKKIGKQKQ